MNHYEDSCCKVKIENRIALDKQAYQKKKSVLTYIHVSLKVRKEFAETFTGVLFCMNVKAELIV